MNKISIDILNKLLSLKSFIEKLCPTCKVTVSNLICRSDNGKASLTVKNVNYQLDALNIDVGDNSNIGGNYLNNSRLHLNSTGYGKPAIYKKMKNLGKNLWSLGSAFYSPNNYEKIFHKITEFNKTKTRGKGHKSSQFVKFKESSNDLNILDGIRLDNGDRLIIGHLNINSLRNKFDPPGMRCL